MTDPVWIYLYGLTMGLMLGAAVAVRLSDKETTMGKHRGNRRDSRSRVPHGTPESWEE